MEKSKMQKSETEKKFIEWIIKIKFLKDQIFKLNKLKDFPILSIALFLLKSQLIEWELKQLIIRMDLYLSFFHSSKILSIKVRTPREMSNEKWTFGRVVKELDRYGGKFLQTLKTECKKLVKLRNYFHHELFRPGNINDLIKKADEGLEITDRIIKEIEKVNTFLNQNDPLKK